MGVEARLGLAPGELLAPLNVGGGWAESMGVEVSPGGARRDVDLHERAA